MFLNRQNLRDFKNKFKSPNLYLVQFIGLCLLFEITSVASSNLSPREILQMTTAVMDSFEVDTSDMNTEVSYISTGSLEINVDAEIHEDEVIDAVAITLADLFDAHPSDVTIVSIDLDTGEVTYEISSDNYDDASTIQAHLNSLELSEIENTIQETIPSLQISNSIIDEDISVDVTFIVDGSDGGNIRDAREEVTEILNGQGFEVDTHVAIVTAKPTVSPTFTTMVPSSRPSITGIVVTLTLKTNEVVDRATIDTLEEQIANDYGVNVNDVTVDTVYTITGTLQVEDISEDLSESELQEALQHSVASALDVHSRNVDIMLDPETGDITYTISNDDTVDMSNIQDALESSSFADELTQEISNVLPTMMISEIKTDGEIQTELVVIIDATESAADVEDANVQVVSSLENEGFSAESESNNRKS